MSTTTKARALAELHYFLADRLAAMEGDVATRIRGMDGITLIVRDPTKPGAILCLSNEPREGMLAAFGLAAGLGEEAKLTHEEAMRIALGLPDSKEGKVTS